MEAGAQCVLEETGEASRLLRIAIITETFLPKIDGIVTRLCHTLRHLRRSGHTIQVFAPSGVDQFEGIPVYGVPGFKFPLYPELKAAIPNRNLASSLRSFEPDLIHAINPAILGVSAFFSSVSLKVPLVVSYHTHLPKYLHYYGMGRLEPLMWWGMRQAYNRADLLLATSQAMQAELEAHGIRRVQLWRRGVDTEMFHPRRGTAAMRDRLTQGHPTEKLLVYVGRLSVEKEIEYCRTVLEALPGIHLALVGDGPHRRKLEQHFAGTKTHFAGFLEGEELAAVYASADAFMLPSRTETLGLVLLEAMAAGCPVVTPRAGGTGDIVQDGVTGHLYDPDNPSGAIEAVKRLLFNADYRAAISRQARADAELWGWNAATRQLENYYRDLLVRESQLAKQIAASEAPQSAVGTICDELQISRATFRRLSRATAESNGSHPL